MPTLVEYEFPVTCSCGHTEILSGPDEVYELRTLESMLSVPCCACSSGRKALEALAGDDLHKAQEACMEWVQFLISADNHHSSAALASFIARTLEEAPGVVV